MAVVQGKPALSMKERALRGAAARRAGRPTYGQTLGDLKTISGELEETPQQTRAYEKLGPKAAAKAVVNKNVQLMDADARDARAPDINPNYFDERSPY